LRLLGLLRELVLPLVVDELVDVCQLSTHVLGEVLHLERRDREFRLLYALQREAIDLEFVFHVLFQFVCH
jgi:hypothetical protein